MTTSLASARYAQPSYPKTPQTVEQLKTAIQQNSIDIITLLSMLSAATEAIRTLNTGIASIPVQIINEVPAGDMDDMNMLFTTAKRYTINSLVVYYNSARQVLGTNYTQTSATTFTLAFAPVFGDTLIVDYLTPRT